MGRGHDCRVKVPIGSRVPGGTPGALSCGQLIVFQQLVGCQIGRARRRRQRAAIFLRSMSWARACYNNRCIALDSSTINTILSLGRVVVVDHGVAPCWVRGACLLSVYIIYILPGRSVRTWGIKTIAE